MEGYYLFVLALSSMETSTCLDPIRVKTIGLYSCPTSEQFQEIKEKISLVSSLDDYLRVSQCGPGLWREVFNLNMSDTSQQCPAGWDLASNPRSCSEPPRTAPRTCSQVTLPVNTTYSKVCGKLIGIARGTNDAFAVEARTCRNYVDGITIFRSAAQPQHVWTFATDHNISPPRCPCNNVTSQTYSVPSFVGTNYFCDIHNEDITFDQAWDASHCLYQSDCCNFNSPPWFYASLLNDSKGNLEVSICGDESTENESIHVQELVLYVR